MNALRTSLIVAALLSFPACGKQPAPAAPTAPEKKPVPAAEQPAAPSVETKPRPAPVAPESKPASSQKYSVEVVATGLQVPWSLVWTGPDRMLVTERPGRVRVIEKGVLRPEPMLKIENILSRSETGLMGMCLHPAYSTNKFVYLAFGDKINKDIRVVRYKDTGSALEEEKVILSGIAVRGNHSGTCIKFGPDGKLYITTGETFNGKLAQDTSSLNGKCLRLNDDGTVPDDNPWAGTNKKEGTRPEIWSLGHRNPQGMDWTESGELFMSEHGPSGEAVGGEPGGGDEFNVVEKGRNYGWPTIHHDMTKDGMESPLKQWTPAIAPTGGAILKSDVYGPAWKGNYFMGALGGLDARSYAPGVYRIELKKHGIGSVERLVPDMGRIRAVAVGPDGLIYFSTSNQDGRGSAFKKPEDDRVCRIVPSN